jgi:plasmid stabilization system protein ParE
MARVIVTGPASKDIEAAFQWWKANRSTEQAKRWYVHILSAIKSLADSPERCAFAREHDLIPQGLRQLLFGLGRCPTHRVVFAIDEDTVIVFRVRHVSQDSLSHDELT